MLSIIKRFIRRRSTQEAEPIAKDLPKPQRMPVPGETWDFNSGPWPPTHTAFIVDVREGWVRYAYSTLGHEGRMEIDRFIRIYSPPTFVIEANR